MRSESCTFIWQPKVLMHAVFDAVQGEPGEASTTGVGVPPIGFLDMETGVEDTAAYFFVHPAVPFVLLLILVLPFVEVGSQDHLSRPHLCLKVRKLKVARFRRPGQNGADSVEVLCS
jgi:hypothetical protein